MVIRYKDTENTTFYPSPLLVFLCLSGVYTPNYEKKIPDCHSFLLSDDRFRVSWHKIASGGDVRPWLYPETGYEQPRSEERSVGKECVSTFRFRGAAYT